jgi:hypothetical protein
MKYLFATNKMDPVEPGSSQYRVFTVEIFARDVATAWQLAEPQIQAVGARLFCWYEEPGGACTMCGGPFHPATGHWVNEKRHWCGPCTRSMIALLKDYLPRRWGGVRFYDLAVVPTGTKDLCPKCRGDEGVLMHTHCILR